MAATLECLTIGNHIDIPALLRRNRRNGKKWPVAREAYRPDKNKVLL
ncbi:hypothetical protein [Bradyrhizobium sp. 17]|nr:hypothetical protein [Bradyrhizobium sp. 17]MCK1524754.1 hypothetical protein [Bradyrhizobium sp. 17]